MPGKATAADADLLLKLYDLRRESELRKARNWMVVTFWPQSADEIMKISANFGSQENNWWRQVSGYWSMAAVVDDGAGPIKNYGSDFHKASRQVQMKRSCPFRRRR